MKKIYVIPDLQCIEQSLQLVHKYGARFEYNDFYLPSVLDDQKKQIKIIDSYAAARQDFSEDTIHGAFLDVILHSSDPLICEISKKRVIQSMEIAKEMGVRAVIFHTGRIQGFREVNYIQNWYKVNENFFRNILERYAKQEIYIENMFDESPDILANLARRMKDQPRFGVCLDYAHAMVFGKESRDWVNALAPYIRHMHINDNDLHEDLHWPLGQGKIDWQAFGEQTQKNCVDASVLIEMKGADKQEQSIQFLRENNLLS